MQYPEARSEWNEIKLQQGTTWEIKGLESKTKVKSYIN